MKVKNPFEYYIKKAFLSYDDDGSGALDHKELRKFLDELRETLNLLPCDTKIFNRILSLLDDNNNGLIEWDEFEKNIPDVLPIVAESGEEMGKLLTKVFNDFDINGNGCLKFKEFKLICDLSCDKIGVERCSDWRVQHIISLMDEDDDAEIDLDEFRNNYRLIVTELQKNRPLTKKQRKKDGGDFFRDRLH